jgi:hypothetical protein
MKHFQLLIASVLAIVFLLSSCKKDDYNQIDSIGDNNSLVKQNEGTLVLGKQLQDPYSLKNMKQAYINLKSANPGTPDIDIQPTHTYMRFLPKNEEEWAILKSDTTLVLYDFPLDYEIENLGTYYHDPSLPADAITWQYCVVPKGHTIPNIMNEMLYEVYIPQFNDNTGLKSSSVLKQFQIDLELESVKLTGNLPGNENRVKSTEGILDAEWTPKGTIKVWDDVIGSTTTYTQVFDHWEYYNCTTGEPIIPPQPVQQVKIQPMMVQQIEPCQRAVYRYDPITVSGSFIPLVQATVHARWFTHVETDLTDNNGYFETSKFNYEVNYAIKWERSNYDIRNGDLLQAWYNGPQQKGDWNLNIKGGESVMYATMHRAAYKYFYGDNLGLFRPTLLDGGRTKICYINGQGTGVFWGDWSGTGILPDIRIWGKNASGDKLTNELFGTTCHELTHQAHSQHLGNIQYWQVSKIIYESWADAGEWGLSNDEYHKLGIMYNSQAGINYDHYRFNNQRDWPLHGGDIAYSPIFIDLVDNVNQRFVFHGGDSRYPNDNVTGFTLENISRYILPGSYGLTSLKNAVKSNKPMGVTDAAIDDLFALY